MLGGCIPRFEAAAATSTPDLVSNYSGFGSEECMVLTGFRFAGRYEEFRLDQQSVTVKCVSTADRIQ